MSGLVDVDPEAARAFCKRWFAGCGGYVGLVGIPVARMGPLGQTVPVEEARAGLTREDLESLVYGGASGELYNAYVNVATLTGEMLSPRRRGGKENVRDVPGVWVDLDVKDGSFGSRDEIYEYVRGLALRPTLGVLSGSGGVHCYWKLREPLTALVAEDVSRTWWAYLLEAAGGRGVDKLVDSTRVMKLPGTVRWPKGEEVGEGVGPAPVELLYADGPEWSLVDLVRLGSEPAKRHQDAVLETRRRVDASRARATDIVKASGRWSELRAIAGVEDEFNSAVSWDEILTPYGWTPVSDGSGGQRTDAAGRRQWSRPGGDGTKSATTDWEDFPDTMSLLSDSEGTGMLDLKEAGVHLSKYRVWVRLAWADDEAGFVQAWLQRS